MTRDDILNEYFEWMCNKVCNSSEKIKYRKLLTLMNDTDYYYILVMDGNRYGDGINLRYRFAIEMNYDDAMVADALDFKPCSILEMMIALAWRIEEHIMVNDDIGDRTGEWFWEMMDSLHISNMTNNQFDIHKGDIKRRLTAMMEKDYLANGEGGLFTVSNPNVDMRNLEVWYQAMAYLNEIGR